MTRISSRMTKFHKVIFPTFWFGLLAVMLSTSLISDGARTDPEFLIGPAVMAVVGFFIMKVFVWDLVDEVYDAGDRLVIRNKSEEDIVVLSDIMNVSSTVFINPPRITLRLARPSKFGTEITFTPVKRFTLNPFAKSPIAEDLIVRVDRARYGNR